MISKRFPTSASRRRGATPATYARMTGALDRPRDAGLPFLHGIPAWGDTYTPEQPATKTLKELIDKDGLEDAFIVAIERVANHGIPDLCMIRSLSQFYFYVDALVTWIPEIRVWEVKEQTVHERTVYLRIVQFYYYFNQPELEELQSEIAPGSGEDLTPISRWLRDFAVAWGDFLDTPASAKHLATFKNAPEYNWQDYEKAPEDYGSFNQFFARQFRDMDRLRPVSRAEDDRTIVFPAESTFVGQWAVSTRVDDGPLKAPPSITVKHIKWSIAELLADSAYAEDFEGGMLCHSFLNTYDYHRLHTPVAGKVLEARFIPGQVYLQVDLVEGAGAPSPNGDLSNAIIPTRYLDADDPTGYQFVQCRGLLVLQTPRMGKVAVLPMGMAQVSSVIFTNPMAGDEPITLSQQESAGKNYLEQVTALNAKIARELVNQDLAKGEMFSYFQFGGSDCVMVFERGANVAVTATRGVHYPIRSQFGLATFNTLQS